MTCPLLLDVNEILAAMVEGRDWTRWGDLAGCHGLLRPALAEGMRGGAAGDRFAHDALRECHSRLNSASSSIARFYERDSRFSVMRVDTERVRANAEALTTTALTWVTACSGDHEGALRWACLSATLLGRTKGSCAPELPDGWAAGSQLIELAYQGLAQAGWRVGRARLWTRWWAGDDVFKLLASGPVRVPVAAWLNGENRGALGHLCLGRLEGEGELVEHPRLATEAMTPDFIGALERALRPSGAGGLYDLDIADSSPAALVHDGDSVSGPAAVGWLALARKELYDPATVVVAKLGEHTQPGGEVLEPVQHAAGKLMAAAEEGIRRAVVPHGTDLSQADCEELSGLGLTVVTLTPVAPDDGGTSHVGPRPHDVAMSSLDLALEEVSGLARQLRDYLEALGSRLGRTLPWHPPAGFGAMRQQVRLAPEGRGADRRAEGRRLSGLDEVEGAATHRREGPGGQPTTGEGVPRPWEQIGDEAAMAVVLGDPGYGKSWLLRHEGMLAINEARAALDAGGPAAAVIPVHLRLPTLALRLPTLASLLPQDISLREAVLDCLHEAVLEAARLPLGEDPEDRIVHGPISLTDPLRSELVARLREGWGVVVLADGLDEVPADRANAVHEALVALAGRVRRPAKLVVTSRIAGYRRPFDRIPDRREWELVAFAEADVARLVAAWYPEGDPRRAAVERARRRSVTLRAQTRVPLLAAFACWVATAGGLPPTRAGLYEEVLWKLLEGAWRPGATPIAEDRVRDKLRVLGALGAAAVGGDGLDGGIVDKVVASYSATESLERTADHDRGLVAELRRDGVLVPAGVPPRGRGWARVPYLFLHRTLGEYLHARHLVETLPDDELVATVKAHAWCDPNWVEVIPLVVGRLSEESDRSPRPLLVAMWGVVKAGDDAFHWVAALLARCLPEAGAHGDDTLEADLVAHLELIMCSPAIRDRRRAAMALAAIGSERAVDGLVRCLGHEDFRARGRWAAADALGDIGSERAVEGLLRCLEDANALVRWSSAKALGAIGSERAVEGLLRCLEDADAEVRRHVAWALGAIGSERAVEGLLRCLGDADAGVRRTAVQALEDVGWSERAVEPLLRCLGDADHGVRRAAAHALEAVVWSERAVDPLLRCLEDADATSVSDAYWSGSVRAAAAEALGDIGSERAVEGLVGRLEDEHALVRWAAAKALGNIGSERAVEPLRGSLWDADLALRYAAEDALRAIGSERAVESLREIKHQASEMDDQVRKDRAVEFLGRLEDEDAVVRAVVAGALEAIGSDGAMELLQDRVQDEDAVVRAAVAGALKAIGSNRAVEGLVGRLEDDDASVRGAAARALGVMVWNPANPTDHSEFAARRVLQAIGSERAVKGLLACLEDKDAWVRAETAEALGRIGSDWAVEGLVGRLGDQDARVSYAAAEALRRIGSDLAVDGLLALLEEDPHFFDCLVSSDIYAQETGARWQAAQTLGDIGSERAVTGLLRCLKGKDAWVRSAAADALGDIGSERAVEGLLRCLGDANALVRWSSAKALVTLDSDRAVEPLLDRLGVTEMGLAAASVLSKMSSRPGGLVLDAVLSSRAVRRHVRFSPMYSSSLTESIYEIVARCAQESEWAPGQLARRQPTLAALTLLLLADGLPSSDVAIARKLRRRARARSRWTSPREARGGRFRPGLPGP